MKKTAFLMFSMLLALCLLTCGCKNRTFIDRGAQKFTATRTVFNMVQVERYNSARRRNSITLSKSTYVIYISEDNKYQFYLRISDAKYFTKGSSLEIRVLQDSDTGELFYINADIPEKDYNKEVGATMKDRLTELPK